MGTSLCRKKGYRKNTVIESKSLYGTSICQYLPTGNLVEIEVTEKNEESSYKSVLDAKEDHEHRHRKRFGMSTKYT